MRLRYGCNPHQKWAEMSATQGAGPVELLHGDPSLINVLDALNAWQLVRELRDALGAPAAASFKHVSPAGAAVAAELPDDLARAYEVRGELTPGSLAYVRARNADPKSSYGDFIALSDPVDAATAGYIKGVISHGIVAPGFEPEALEILKKKRGGAFVVFRGDPDFEAPEHDAREMLGVRIEQDRNAYRLSDADLRNVICGSLTDAARRDLLLGLITLKYTQSNSVGYSLDGQMIGVGAGQQSRVDCTKLAGQKADVWHLRRHPKVLELPFRRGVKKQDRINWRIRYIEGDLTPMEAESLRTQLERPYEPLTQDERQQWLHELCGVSLTSDGVFPFRDNVDHAHRHGVKYMAHPGGSIADAEVKEACEALGISMVHTGIRLFHH